MLFGDSNLEPICHGGPLIAIVWSALDGKSVVMMVSVVLWCPLQNVQYISQSPE